MVQSTPAPSSHNYLSQRLRLHYVDWGNPQAPPLLLLHGGRDHCRNWDWIAAQLCKDWHVIAPDLRGHGDSQWSQDGNYSMVAFIYDLAQFVELQQLAPLTLVGHSLGGNICLRFTGIYPDKVHKVVAIEGLGPSPEIIAKEAQIGIAERMHKWITEQHVLATRQPRRYKSFEDALRRMQEENKHLSIEQTQHLTQHGVKQNDDGTYSWKFDGQLRSWPPVDMTRPQIEELWSRISCPALLVYGKDSWASNPQQDGRVRHFRNAQVATVEQAGHWVHHDQPQQFMALLREFL
jgi:pimeloyl-ACP methyl ester carboxylesterase